MFKTVVPKCFSKPNIHRFYYWSTPETKRVISELELTYHNKRDFELKTPEDPGLESQQI